MLDALNSTVDDTPGTFPVDQLLDAFQLTDDVAIHVLVAVAPNPKSGDAKTAIAMNTMRNTGIADRGGFIFL